MSSRLYWKKWCQFEQKDAKNAKILGIFVKAMHPKFEHANELSRRVIGAAIEVHKLKGPGLLESIYEKCLMRELFLQGIPAQQQVVVPIEYKGFTFDEPMNLDVFVDDCLILELKAVTEVLPIHKAQLLSYMRLMDIPLGLLINFHEMQLVKGVHRLILPGADSSNERKA